MNIILFCEPGFSHSSEKLVDMHDYVATVDKDATLVFVVCNILSSLSLIVSKMN